MADKDFDARKAIESAVGQVQSKKEAQRELAILMQLFKRLQKEILSAIADEQKEKGIDDFIDGDLRKINADIKKSIVAITQTARSAHISSVPTEGPLREFVDYLGQNEALAGSWNRLIELLYQKMSAHCRERDFISKSLSH